MTTILAEAPPVKDKKTAKAKAKRVSASEQYTNLQAACRTVRAHLARKGIDLSEYDVSIQPGGDGQRDLKTNAMVTTAQASVAFLLMSFSGLAHWFQRRTFNHTHDAIYQRLIIAI